MITFTDVSKSFDGRTVLDKISFSVTPGEFVCITGPSGAGKSTIIHLLIRAEKPTGGRIDVDGVNLAKLSPMILQMYRRRMGVLFQDYKLLADRTVYENIAFALEVCGETDAIIASRVPELLKRVGLGGRGGAFPRELSGGEKARAGLARALVHKPMIVVADEPTGNIDPKQSLDILALLKQVHAEGTTVILATHDQMLVDALQTRVLRLENGKIVRDGVGGYHAATQPVSSTAARKHEIFDGRKYARVTKAPVSQMIKPSPAVSTSEQKIDTEKSALVQQKDQAIIQDPIIAVQASVEPEMRPKNSGRVKPIAI